MRFLTNAAVAALALCHTGQALKATILADTDRDGRVDVDGHSDIAGKAEWTADRGALFLANIGDTDQRCSKKLPVDDWDNEFPVDACNDASDDTQRNPKYLAPLRVLPCGKLGASAKGSIRVTDEVAAKNVRIFVKEDEEWTYVAANRTFTAEELEDGLELGIDARDVRRPGGWDGKAEVHFTVSDGYEKETDSVALRVAPVLTHHHAQLAERFFTTDSVSYKPQLKFISDFEENVAAAGIDEPVFLFEGQDIWTQDFFEPGYTSIPGPDGPIGLRVMIRSAQSYRQAGREIFRRLRSDTVGAVQHPGGGGTIDSTGNLETIPPYTHNGKTYPAGRIIQGQWDGKTPLIFDFLKAQEVQSPIALDTAWLSVGHVDEFLQFLPADNERGWVLLADDPRAGLALLEKASDDGHGSTKAVSRTFLPGEDQWMCLPQQTVDEVLKLSNFTAINEHAAERIEGNLAILKRETGLTNAEIFRIPALFYYELGLTWDCDTGTRNGTSATKRLVSGGPASKVKSIIEAASPPGVERRQTTLDDSVVAFYPGTINGVVLTESLVLAPNPWGPVVDGVDILAAAVEDVYARVNKNVTFMDDWFSHHVGSGEVHCGSNTWRNIDAPWW
ncbi:hypothetical protein AK830_g6023 [Neonectria ditissima]|uniref:Protein-arginine deiminase C-terminal domain-containing protein n=1 Tax=Neonectria ditissima TaxID=78410 RepID=A0A0P7BHV7_9HYPO|nr:hypothetical protein AK830_g6023 [Neonectria ditissima]